MLFLAETSQGPAIFVGPTFTYYEHLEKGLPPHRLTDEEWHGLYKGYGQGQVEFIPPE